MGNRLIDSFTVLFQNKTVQKMKSLRKSVEKERNSLHHNFEHSRDLRKSEVYISHARQIDHRRRMVYFITALSQLNSRTAETGPLFLRSDCQRTDQYYLETKWCARLAQRRKIPILLITEAIKANKRFVLAQP